MAPICQQFQLGGQWQFSNQKGPSFEVTSALNNAKDTMNPALMNADDVQTVVLRYASD